MPVTYEFHSVALSLITVPENRQRSKLKGIEELADSIDRIGLLHPIIINRAFKLIAGERRLRAFQKLNKSTIPVHYLDELNEFEAHVIELEENIRRVDLTWKESCFSTAKYHQMRKDQDSEWTQKQTAEAVGLSSTHVSHLLLVAKAMLDGDTRVENATNFDAAYRVIMRDHDRAVSTEISQMDFVNEELDKEEGKETSPKRKEDYHIIVADFTSWCKTYKGRKFNLVHCDFPYGVHYGKTTYSGSETWGKYDDSPKIFFELLRHLIKYKDSIFFSSSHLVFWLSMNYYAAAVDGFERAGFKVNPFPLVWHKDRGLVPDPQRGPRRVYEVALFASLGDRKIVRPVPNLAYHKVEKEGHISTKPQLMLEHFLAMFVDNLTEILDPTCGSGTALAAARVLGAKRFVGLDIEEEHVETAKLNFDLARRKEDGDH